jgi:glycosyltransferase involved in cell wall biosynthesis
MTSDGAICILHVLSDDAVGGGTRYLADLARHCGREFRHAVALPSKGAVSDLLQAAGLAVEIVDTRRRLSLRGVRDIRRCARRRGADILHTHGFRSTLYGRLALLFAGVKLVTTVHVSLYDYADTPGLVRSAYILAERLLAFRTDRYICISDAMRADALRLGAAPARTVLVPNGVDTDRFHPRPASPALRHALGIFGPGPVIGTVGRAVTEKGQAHLLDALPLLRARWPHLRCLFVGDGPALGGLRRRAADLAVETHCLFPGVRRDVEEIYPLLDVFVLPSPREPFGLALLEAMATGIPVIATAAGGPPDFIRHGVNGLLIPPRDAVALAGAIEGLLDDPDLAHRMAAAGRSTAVREYPIERNTAMVAAVYRDALGLSDTPGIARPDGDPRECGT